MTRPTNTAAKTKDHHIPSGVCLAPTSLQQPDHSSSPAHWRPLQTLLPTTSRPPGDLSSPLPCSKLQAPTGKPAVLTGTPQGCLLCPPPLSPCLLPRGPSPFWTSMRLFSSLGRPPLLPPASSHLWGLPRTAPSARRSPSP